MPSTTASFNNETFKDTLVTKLSAGSSAPKTWAELTIKAGRLGKSIYEFICDVEHLLSYAQLRDIFAEVSKLPVSDNIEGRVISISQRFIETDAGIYIWHPAAADKLKSSEDTKVFLISKKVFDTFSSTSTFNFDTTAFEDAMHIKEDFEHIIKDAVNSGATDVHFYFQQGLYKLVYRILGDLQEIQNFSITYGRLMCSVIMNYAKTYTPSLRIDEIKRPQDGRIEIENMELDLRLSFIPKPKMKDFDIAIRLLRKESLADLSMSDLGYSDKHCRMLTAAAERTRGLIIVSGATGSGKSKSVNTLLSTISPTRNVLTIEDPIEYPLAHGRQFQTVEWEDAVTNKISRASFPDFSRAFKRHDPDVIFIGEIRDKETVETAMHLSKTGHLVFGTLHVSRATMIPEMLINDFGVDINSVADNLVLGVNQVLVKALCEHCKEEARFAINDTWLRLLRFGNRQETLSRIEGRKVYERNEKGCARCSIMKGKHVLSSGYIGRTLVAEVFEFRPEDFIDREISSFAMERKYAEQGTLLDDAVDKIAMGRIDKDALKRLL